MPGDVTMISSGENAAILHCDQTGASLNRLPHVSALVAMTGIPPFIHAHVYDLSGVHGFAGTQLPRRMFDAEDDAWFGFLEPDHFGQIDTG